jgi:hypothetical protein
MMAISSLCLIGLYFVNFPSAPDGTPRPDLEQWARTTLQFLSMGFGLFSLSDWYWWAGVGLVLILTTVLALVWTLLRQPAERGRASGLLAFLAAMLGLALAIGWGRGTVGPFGGCAFRYVSLAAPWLCASYFALLLYAPAGVRTLAQNALMVGALLMLWPSTENGSYYARHQRDLFVDFVRDGQNGVPIPFLADRYSHFPAQLYPDPKRFGAYLSMLPELNMVEFQNLRDSPPLREIHLPENAWFAGRDQAYTFTNPPGVIGLRIKCGFQKSTRQAFARINWQYHVPGQPSQIQNASQLLEITGAEEQTVLIYVDGVVRRLQFQLGPGFQDFRVLAIYLLVAGDDHGAAKQ